MPEVGQTLGRYTLLKKLATGGMGEIFLASRAGPLGWAPPVALKVLKEEFATDRQFVEMLVDEANITMFLNHQNVVSVLDFGESDGTYYIAMEYVQGLTLKQVLETFKAQKRIMSVPVALYVASELCRALKYAHTRHNHDGEPLNIIHRDVTPGNVLLSTQGEVKLTDFGIARARGRSHQTQAGVLKGKFGYMAPEMIRYERLDARADLFCVGVVVYEMVAGRHPVEGAAIMEAIHRFEERRIDPPSQFNPSIPKALDVILLRALEPKPADRWASANALGNALQDVALQTPEVRKEIRVASASLIEMMRDVSASSFDNPVPKETLDRLLEESRAKASIAQAELDGGPTNEERPALRSASSQSGAPPRDPSPFELRPAVSQDASGALPAIGPDHDNFDSIPPTFIPTSRSQQELLSPRAQNRFDPRLIGDEEDPTYESPKKPVAPEEEDLAEAATLAMNAITPEQIRQAREAPRPDPAIAFSDGTDKDNPRAGMIAEPRLPGADPTGPQAAVSPAAKRISEPAGNAYPSIPIGGAIGGPSVGDTTEEESAQSPYSDDRTMAAQMVVPDSEPAPPRQDLDDKTIAGGMEIPDWDAIDAGRSPSAVSAPIVASVGSVEDADTDEQAKYDEPALDKPLQDRSASYLDDKTAYNPGFQLPPDDDDEAPTILPHDPAEPAPSFGGTDRTILDLNAVPSEPASFGARVVSVDEEPELPADVDANKQGGYSDDATVAGVIAGPNPHDARPRLFSEPGIELAIPGDPTTLGVVSGDEVETSESRIQYERTLLGVVSEPPGPRSAVPDPDFQFSSAPKPKLEAPARPTPAPPRPSKPSKPSKPSGMPAPSVSASSHGMPAPSSSSPDHGMPEPSASAGSTPGVSTSQGYIPGPATAQWMAGQLPPDKLSWSDEDAARRVIATRNAQQSIPTSAPAHHPHSGIPNPQVMSPYPQSAPPPIGQGHNFIPPQMTSAYPRPNVIAAPSSRSNNLLLILAVVLLFASVLGLVGITFFTKAFWPRIVLISDPPGATVSVDGAMYGSTRGPGDKPLKLKLKPNESHAVEMKLEGYPAHRFESVDLNFFGESSLSHRFERQVRTLHISPVAAKVFIGEREIGVGTKVELPPDLPDDQAVQIRVEAEGYIPWQTEFKTGAAIPKALDVPLSKAEEVPQK